MLTGRALRRAPAWLIWALTLLPCGLIGGFVASRRPAWSGVVAITSLAALALMSLGLFSRNIWLDITAPWLGGGLTYLFGIIGRARRHERESTRVASTIEAVSQVSEVIAAQTSCSLLLMASSPTESTFAAESKISQSERVTLNSRKLPS